MIYTMHWVWDMTHFAIYCQADTSKNDLIYLKPSVQSHLMKTFIWSTDYWACHQLMALPLAHLWPGMQIWVVTFIHIVQQCRKLPLPRTKTNVTCSLCSTCHSELSQLTIFTKHCNGEIHNQACTPCHVWQTTYSNICAEFRGWFHVKLVAA